MMRISIVYGRAHHPPRRGARLRLKLVEVVLPATSERACCGGVWERDAQVRLPSPVRRGSRSPACAALDDAPRRLDAACYAASSTTEVSRTCAANPHWRLRCVPIDASDHALLAIAGVLHARARRTHA